VRGWLFVEKPNVAVSDKVCDSERAYDLGTGAVFEARSCVRWIVKGQGSFDREATEKTRRIESARGSVPRSALSEVVWFLLQMGKLYDRAVSRGYEVPTGLEPTYTPDEPSAGARGFSFDCRCGNCGEFGLWTYVIEGSTIAQGVVTTWAPNCWETHAGAQAYAAELLNIAERKFVDGCPSENPPRLRPPRSIIVRESRRPDRELDVAWQRLLYSSCPAR